MSHQQLLTQQYLNDTLPHAILIKGAKGSGKLALAQWLVHVLLCQTLQKEVESSSSARIAQVKELSACGHCKTCLLANNRSYPDHLTLELTGTSIGIEEVRKTNAFLEKTAHIGKFKSILIPDAQNMTVAAANALLKTLEEPSPNSIIILLSHDIELLLPTIISRCRLLTMKGQVGEALVKQFTQHGNGDVSEKPVDFVNLSHLPELQDKAVNEAYKLFELCYLNYLTSAKEREQGSERLLKLMCEQGHTLRWLEKITVNLLREQFLPVSLMSSTMKAEQVIDYKKLSPQILNKLYKAIIEASKVLKLLPQANETFVLEKLHLSLHDIVNAK